MIMDNDLLNKGLNIFLEILKYGGWPAFLVALIYIYKNDEQFDRWLARGERFLTWFGLRREKNFITRDLQARINTFSKRANKEAEGVVTNKVQVVWVTKDNIESFLRKGTVIIKMKHLDNHDENVVNAATHYVSKGILPNARKYIDEQINKALDLILVKKILVEEDDKGTSTEFFFKSTLTPSLDSDTNLKNRFQTLEMMENNGLLTRILLREMRIMGKKLHPQVPTRPVLDETKKFFDFLEALARRERGENIGTLNFIDQNIKVGILYVARGEVISLHGYVPYKKRIEQKIKLGSKNIYMFARRKNNILAVKEIADSFRQRQEITDVNNFEFKTRLDHEVVPAICTLIRIKA